MASQIDWSLFAFSKKGTHAMRAERVEKQHTTRREEIKAKRTSKQLTGGRCRWPHQTAEERRLCAASPKHSAHLKDKGMGGDHGKRSTPGDVVTVCAPVHEGPDSVHAKKKRIVPLTDRKGLGPCAFEEKRGGKWVEVGREISVELLEKSR